MPVHVEMDFINPAAESVQNFWRQLPPPVQQGAPIIGAGLLTALIVHRIERGRLRAEVSSSPLNLGSRNTDMLG